MLKNGSLVGVMAISLLSPVTWLYADDALAANATAAITTTQVQVTGKITVTITAPFLFTFSPNAPSIPCSASPGTVVSTMTPSGGDGNTISYTMTGDTQDFALSGNNIVVGANGIAAANCGTTQNLAVVATQP